MPTVYGLIRRAKDFLSRLKPPRKIQRFRDGLDDIPDRDRLADSVVHAV